MARTPNQIVATEVHCCLSYLVSTLVDGANASTSAKGLEDLCQQAWDLACPIADYEEAAIQAGWEQGDGCVFFVDTDGDRNELSNWEEACNFGDIEPYDRDVFEHWAVSDWLADKLEAEGEKIDRDFAGLVVWARTTSGQAIAADSVIETIVSKLSAV